MLMTERQKEKRRSTFGREMTDIGVGICHRDSLCPCIFESGCKQSGFSGYFFCWEPDFAFPMPSAEQTDRQQEGNGVFRKSCFLSRPQLSF